MRSARHRRSARPGRMWQQQLQLELIIELLRAQQSDIGPQRDADRQQLRTGGDARPGPHDERPGPGLRRRDVLDADPGRTVAREDRGDDRAEPVDHGDQALRGAVVEVLKRRPYADIPDPSGAEVPERRPARRARGGVVDRTRHQARRGWLLGARGNRLHTAADQVGQGERSADGRLPVQASRAEPAAGPLDADGRRDL